MAGSPDSSRPSHAFPTGAEQKLGVPGGVSSGRNSHLGGPQERHPQLDFPSETSAQVPSGIAPKSDTADRETFEQRVPKPRRSKQKPVRPVKETDSSQASGKLDTGQQSEVRPAKASQAKGRDTDQRENLLEPSLQGQQPSGREQNVLEPNVRDDVSRRDNKAGDEPATDKAGYAPEKQTGKAASAERPRTESRERDAVDPADHQDSTKLDNRQEDGAAKTEQSGQPSKDQMRKEAPDREARPVSIGKAGDKGKQVLYDLQGPEITIKQPAEKRATKLSGNENEKFTSSRFRGGSELPGRIEEEMWDIYSKVFPPIIANHHKNGIKNYSDSDQHPLHEDEIERKIQVDMSLDHRMLRKAFGNEDTTFVLLRDKQSQKAIGFTYYYPKDKISKTAEIGFTGILPEFRGQGGWSLMMDLLDENVAADNRFTHMEGCWRQEDNIANKVATRYGNKNAIVGVSEAEDPTYGKQRKFTIALDRLERQDIRDVAPNQPDAARLVGAESAKSPESPKEVDDRKPVVLVFGDHNERGISNLETFREEIENMLASSPEGQVAVYIEDNDMLRSRSRHITKLVKEGWLPSEAFAASTSAYADTRVTLEDVRYWKSVYGHGLRNPLSRQDLDEYEEELMRNPQAEIYIGIARPYTREHIQLWRREQGFEIKDQYTREQYEILDELVSDNPGRILLIPEQGVYTMPSYDINTLLQNVVKDAAAGNFKSKNYQNILFHLHIGTYARRESALRSMRERLQEDNVIGLVGKLGPGHAGLEGDLKKDDNFDVGSVFTEADGNKYIFNPIQETVLQHRDLVGEWSNYLTPEEAKVALSRTVIWRFMSEAATKTGKMTEQQVLKRIWEATEHFTIDEADAFESDIKENGVQKAIKKVFAKAKEEGRIAQTKPSERTFPGFEFEEIQPSNKESATLVIQTAPAVHTDNKVHVEQPKVVDFGQKPTETWDENIVSEKYRSLIQRMESQIGLPSLTKPERKLQLVEPDEMKPTSEAQRQWLLQNYGEFFHEGGGGDCAQNADGTYTLRVARPEEMVYSNDRMLIKILHEHGHSLGVFLGDNVNEELKALAFASMGMRVYSNSDNYRNELQIGFSDVHENAFYRLTQLLDAGISEEEILSHLTGKRFGDAMPNDYLKHIEKKGNEEKEIGAAIYDLRNATARERLSSTLTDSNGNAIVIVHPFFPEYDGGGELDDSVDERQYLAYTQALQSVIRDNSGIPLIIFEHEPELPFVSNILKRLGIDSSEVFLVPTDTADTRPLKGNLENLVKQLQNLGLTETTVNGSYFLRQTLPDGGCANHILNTFRNAGIIATAGKATF